MNANGRNDSLSYANQQAALNGGLGAYQADATITSVRSDIERRIACLEKGCAEFEQLKAKQQVRQLELNRLRAALACLEPLESPPVGDSE